MGSKLNGMAQIYVIDDDKRAYRKRIEVVSGDITNYPADALVCPANADLSMVAFPGNVQYAFLTRGGEEIFREAERLGKKLRKLSMDTAIPMSVPETSAHLTKAGKLPARWVIHSVAVGYDLKKDGLYCDGNVIRESTINVLELARKQKMESIGFPALGTGLYNVPLEEAVESMGREFKTHLCGKTSLERIGLVLYSQDQFLIGKEVLDNMFKRKK